jgi:hypothetical protein
MSIPVKFMIGVFSLIMSMMVVMSWFDGQTTFISSNQMTGISKMGDASMVGGQQTTGESSTNVQWGSGIWNTITSWVDFDFSFWYSSIETGWTQTTCETAGGVWDTYTPSSGTAIEVCKFPNQWDIVHTIVFRPIGWGIVLSFIAIGIGKLFGVF